MSTFGTARAPGSSANLGPGFDVLAIALAAYVEVTVEPSTSFSVSTRGYGAEVAVGPEHLVARVARRVLGHDRIHCELSSDLPLARGLGSSAALALVTAAALGAPDPLSIAVEFEGHPENAAASMVGGACAAGVIDGEVLVRALPLDPELSCVVVVPEHRLSTERARDALQASYQRSDVVFNLQRAVLLGLSLGDLRTLRPGIFDDRIHQRQRSVLYPQADQVLAALVEHGALGACWSGAGSTMIGFVAQENAEVVATLVREDLVRQGLENLEVTALGFDRIGLTLGSERRPWSQR